MFYYHSYVSVIASE